MTNESPHLSLGYEDCLKFYEVTLADSYKAGIDQFNDVRRDLAEKDLFFFLVFILGVTVAMHPWIYERCREVQREPDGCLDLWSREHFKSTVITFALTIWDILHDPEVTIGIFSHTKGIARKFLLQIKQELETNQSLPLLWPDVFYAEPKKQSPKWSEEGLIVKRKENPKEATVEAWGLVDGQPTSKHYAKRIYDDVVTLESVSTPLQIQKTTEAWQMSDNLGREGGVERYIGTRYHLFDTYSTMIESGTVKVRKHPATDNGQEWGNPVLMSAETLAKKRKVQGPYVFASQMLLNPVADKAMGFQREWLDFDDIDYNLAMKKLWRFILVDPAGGKQRKDNDYTTMLVIGHGGDLKYRILDIRRDRMKLSTKAETLIELHRKWNPGLVAYEEYGMQADIEHIQYVQKQELYEFPIHPLGGPIKKELRILGLIPYFENGYKSEKDGGDGLPKSRIIFPRHLHQIDYNGIRRDLVRDFIEEEFVAFPVLKHDDMIDCLARIQDLERDQLIQVPRQDDRPSEGIEQRISSAYRKQTNGQGKSWMTA